MPLIRLQNQLHKLPITKSSQKLEHIKVLIVMGTGFLDEMPLTPVLSKVSETGHVVITHLLTKHTADLDLLMNLLTLVAGPLFLLVLRVQIVIMTVCPMFGKQHAG